MNNLEDILKEGTNEVNESISQALIAQQQAVHACFIQQMLLAFGGLLYLTLIAWIGWFLYKWFRNTEQHLKTISIAVQKKDETARHPVALNAERNSKRNQASKPQDQLKQVGLNRTKPATIQDAPPESDLPYLPKS
jgi:hypothetical protein